MSDSKSVSDYTPLPMPQTTPVKRLVTVAATQMHCTADAARNEATAEALVREAHAKGANIILIQELFQALYFCQEQRADLFSLAAPATLEENPLLRRFAALSAELNVVLPISFFERANKAHYNSIVIIDAGKIVGLYRKAHIPDGPGYTEKFYFNPGDTGFKVFRTQFGVIGVAICWDQWFPEAARAMALMGAELLFYPTAIGTEPQDATIDSRFHWQRVMQGHAGANLVPVIASNRIGKEKDIRFYGKSFIAGPLGQLVADADDSKQTVLTHTFDLNEIHVQRTSWGVFRDRRPDLYTPLLSLDGSSSVAAVSGLPPHRGFFHHRPGHGAHGHGQHHGKHGHPKCGPSSAGFSSLQGENGALTTPLRDGYRFPAEWEPHAGTWMLWPTRVGTWRNKASFGQAAFAEVAKAISEFEPVTVCVPSSAYVTARRQLPRRIKVVEMAQDDAWARDIGPTWVVNDTDRVVRAIDWEFNSWGGETEGCYSDWSQDQLVKEKIAGLTAQQTYKCPYVVEGGAIHTDGQGTLLTTEECMLNPNRLLPSEIAAGIKTRTREGMNEAFRTYLGVSKVIWLPHGVYGDKDTNGHIDNLACFVAPGHIALTWTDDTKDPQYAISSEALRILESSTDARGRKIIVTKVHQPDPQLMTKDEIDGLDQAAIGLATPAAGTETKTSSLIGGGTDMGRRVGDRMAASYINFYITNGGVIVPAFGDRVHDALAVQTIASLFPGRRVVQVYSREILLGGGNIHCITQQEPAVPAAAAPSS